MRDISRDTFTFVKNCEFTDANLPKVFASSLDEAQRDTFFKLYYDFVPTDLDDSSSPIPWGAPWLFGTQVVLYGYTVADMVLNYFCDFGDDIHECFC